MIVAKIIMLCLLFKTATVHAGLSKKLREILSVKNIVNTLCNASCSNVSGCRATEQRKLIDGIENFNCI